MATEYTANYNLDLYVNEDKPNLRDQYNGAMRKIDSALVAEDAKFSTIDGQIVTLNQNYTSVSNSVSNMETNVDALDEAINQQRTGILARLDTAESDIDDLLADNQTNISEIAQNKSNITTLDNSARLLRTDVNSLDGRVLGLETRTGKIEDDVEELQQTKKEVIVILGDSWSDPSVAAAKWPETIKTLFGGSDCEIHNYAKNGCRASNGTFQSMYNAFVNDTSFDKSTITRVILMYGVNDYYTTHVSIQDEHSYLLNMYNSVITQLPSNVNIDWFINFCYGKYGYSMQDQINYWNTITNVLAYNASRLIAHRMWSWFTSSELNQSAGNYFHLTENASKGHLAHNVYRCLTGGEPIKYFTYLGSYSGINLQINVEDTQIFITFVWTVSSSQINHNAVTFSPAVIPIDLPNGIAMAGPYSGCRFLFGSSDAVQLDRVTFIQTAPTSSALNGQIAELHAVLNVGGA